MCFPLSCHCDTEEDLKMEGLLEYPAVLMATFGPTSITAHSLGTMVLALLAGLFFIKKLLRLAIIVGFLAGVAYVLESQGVSLFGNVTSALNELPLQESLNLLRGDR